MELRSRKIHNEKVAVRKEGSESRKRRRSNRTEKTIDVKDMERQRLRCLIEGGLWENTSSSEYEPDYGEDEGSDGEVSLEAESNLEGEILGTDSVEEDWISDIPEGSCQGQERKKWSCTQGRWRSGGLGRSPVAVEECGPSIEGGNGKSEVRCRKGSGHWWRGGEDNDVVLLSRCTLKKLVAVNARMTATQRAAVEGTVLRACLHYCDIGMERHLTLALIKCWVPRWKAFRIGGRRVSFSVFDVALMTGLPATGRTVELEGEEVSSEVAVLLRARMDEWEQEEMMRRVPSKHGKKRRFFRNYVAAMAELCEEISDDERVGQWLQMYAFMILSGVLFPRTPYGAAWTLLQYVEDMNAMGEYAWAEAVWRVLVETIEDTQKKLSESPLSEVQLNGFCVLIQVMIE